MKKIVLGFFMLCLYLNSFAQNNVGIGTSVPDPSSILELRSTNQGLLVPRTTIAAVMTAYPTPSLGLLIYDTDSSCFVVYTGPATLWHNLCNAGSTGVGAAAFNNSVGINPDGTIFVIDSNSGRTLTSSPTRAWITTGNSGTTAGTNFVGTTDPQDLVIKSNNTEVMRATQGGAVGINQPSPNASAILDIVSTAKGVLFPSMSTVQRDAITAPAIGLTIFNSDVNIKVHQFWNGTCWVNVGQTVCSFVYNLTQSHTSDCLLVSNFSSVSDTLTVALISGTPSPVVLSAAGVPTGVLVNFSNNYLTPTQTSVMTFTALPSAVSGTYTITIVAASGSTVQTLTYTLVVFGFNLVVSPPDTTISSGSLTPGGYISQATVSIGNASACGSSGGTAQLSATGVPGTVNISFGTTTLSIPGSTTITFTSNCPPAGVYPITIQAMIGVTSSYATYTLTITPPAPIHITASQNNVDLATLIGPGHCAGSDTIYVDPGVTIGSASATLPAMTTGAIPPGGSITIINNGSIIGAGGDGGSDPGSLSSSSCPSADGLPGGDAIFIASNIITHIINNGVIASGGGGGGAGAALSAASLSLCVFSGGAAPGGSGGGGAGVIPGAGGANSSCNAGSQGTAAVGGAGGAAPSSGGCGCPGLFGFGSGHSGAGGSGGALGQSGNNGSSGTSGTGVCPAGIGGAPGYSVNGNGCSCAIVSGTTPIGPVRP